MGGWRWDGRIGVKLNLIRLYRGKVGTCKTSLVLTSLSGGLGSSEGLMVEESVV